jgi:hypothetical protein
MDDLTSFITFGLYEIKISILPPRVLCRKPRKSTFRTHNSGIKAKWDVQAYYSMPLFILGSEKEE